MFLLDFLFPKRCVGCRKIGDFLCSDCFSRIEYTNTYSCPECLRPSLNGLTHPACIKKYGLDGVFPAVTYKGIVKKLLYQFKYSPYLSSLSELLGDVMYEGIIQNESFNNILASKPVIVTVPLSAKRQRQRGYNHAELLGKDLGFKLGLKVENILIRKIDTKPQYKLKKAERVKNIKGAFSMSHNIKLNLKNKTIILVDDIATTYATLKECAKVLKHAGAGKVYGVVFAKEA